MESVSSILYTIKQTNIGSLRLELLTLISYYSYVFTPLSQDTAAMP